MNIYLAAAGLLLILLSAAHALWGERRVFPLISGAGIGGETLVSVYVPWHQLTFVLLAGGAALVWSAFQTDRNDLPLFVLVVVAGNFATFIAITTIRRQLDLLRKSMPQSILFLLLMGLIVLGLLS